MEEGHDGVCCRKGHHVCPECCQGVIEDILSSPETKIPAKCCICQLELSIVQIEKHMTSDQIRAYNMHYTANSIDKTADRLIKCPFCSYFEIWDINNTSNFFYCLNENCKKGSCSVCFKEFNVPSSFTVTEKQREEMESHYKCLEHQEMKKDWDRAIERGAKRFCPTCGTGVVKDDNCVEMNCVGCKTRWCYFCGKKEADLDKEVKDGQFYLHCEDWIVNKKRCPQFLEDIYEIDPRWHEFNCDFNNDFFLKLITYKEIQKFFKKYTKEQFQSLCDAVPSVANHGYDLEEVMKANTKLINR
ncbi:unnamed protein product [Moneuplotes crassus]|uniref:RING-type domain-containing protein n=1 Tax=Euplotes crassus TaxID=5936 RepID=A0AAD1XPT3_EUPCR|nr:unnamed protein product [Moneuplotes crassus]